MATGETGCYHLVFRLRHPTTLTIGKLGTFRFAAGWYVYTGSAFGPGGIAARIARHRRPGTAHWHVDYLAAVAELVQAVPLPDSARRECEHARAVQGLPGASVPVQRFGASDCRCVAHLVYFRSRPFRGGA